MIFFLKPDNLLKAGLLDDIEGLVDVKTIYGAPAKTCVSVYYLLL